MNEELSILYKVQQADTEIARLRDALAGLDTGVELGAEAAAVEAELEAVRQQHRATEKEYVDSELELKTLEEKRGRFQSQLYGGAVRNPRQLSDLQGEVKMLSREIGKVEDRMLELMEALEGQRSAIAAQEARLKELRDDVNAVCARYEKTGSRLRAEIRDLEVQREQYGAQVGRDLLRRYEQIRGRQGNLGLVKVTGSTCPGCRIALPSETVKALRAGRANLSCDNCGRLLFWDEPED